MSRRSHTTFGYAQSTKQSKRDPSADLRVTDQNGAMINTLTATMARRRDWLRLAACVAAMGVAWLVALPWLARTPAVRERIARDEAMGVNPSAKFYTELPATPRIVARVQEIDFRQASAHRD